LVGNAVKVTIVPEQIVVAEAEMVTDGVTDTDTVMVMLLEVAVVGEAQLSEDVRTQVMTSPFARELFT
jgi:hypothetical protein